MTLEFRGLSLGYRVSDGALPAVENADAVFPSGGVCAIVGPSGCGKTSLILSAAGLLAASSGEILADGKVLSGVRERTAVIFQDFGLLPWYTVEGNAELPLRIRGIPRRERSPGIKRLLEELGLYRFKDFYPGKLSGGMKQRVAFARALALEPDLLLMDEPFSSLDALTREVAQEFLLSLRARRPLTIVLVTHSIEEAVYLADTVFVMTGRNPGRFTARFDVPENDPQKRFARDLDAGAEPCERDYGDPGFRESPRYSELCRAVRAALRGAENGVSAALEALP